MSRTQRDARGRRARAEHAARRRLGTECAADASPRAWFSIGIRARALGDGRAPAGTRVAVCRVGDVRFSARGGRGGGESDEMRLSGAAASAVDDWKMGVERARGRASRVRASSGRARVTVASAYGGRSVVGDVANAQGGRARREGDARSRDAREAERYLPDVPKPAIEFAVEAKRVVGKVLGPVYEAYVPYEVKEVVAEQLAAERASGYALYAGEGGAEEELAIYLAVIGYFLLKPGVVPWIFDQTVSRAVGAALEKKFNASDVKRGAKLGGGSFGTVYRAEDEKSGREIVIKVANNNPGASELQIAEAYINRRVARTPNVASGCARFLGTYDEVEGARTPVLVWAYEEGSESTLEDFLSDRSFPYSLEEALGIRARESESEAKRVNKVAKKVMRDLLSTVAGLHDIGIVHRDLKPSNLVLMGKRFKLIDFGAACDLRSGENYDPEQGLLDPKYSPPEQFIMSEKTPAPPPLVAGFLAPLLWTLAQPQLFDSYSAGLILLQLGIPQLRSSNVMAPNGAFQRRLEEANYDLRKWRRDVEENLGWDFSALDVSGGTAWDLACRLVTKRNVIRRGRLDVGAALAHPFLTI